MPLNAAAFNGEFLKWAFELLKLKYFAQCLKTLLFYR